MLPIPMTRLFTRGAFDQLEVHFAIKIALRENQGEGGYHIIPTFRICYMSIYGR